MIPAGKAGAREGSGGTGGKDIQPGPGSIIGCSTELFPSLSRKSCSRESAILSGTTLTRGKPLLPMLIFIFL